MARLWRNQHLAEMQQSYIRRMTRECQRVGGINLGQGVCDLPTPPPILQATSEAILADHSIYSSFEGKAELREQIARKLATYNGLTVDPDRELVVTVGSAGAFVCTCQALLNPGDEVVVFEPFYGYHVNGLRGMGLVPAFVPLAAPNWALDADLLAQAITPRTRAIIVNTPANPSGKVFSGVELAAIRDLCTAHDLLVITDEIYEYIVYEQPHISPATVPGLRERTVTLSGFSKTFSITGWRLGYACARPELAERIGLVNDLFYICAPTPLQHGLAIGMAQLGTECYRELAADYRAKRDEFCAVLAEIGLTPHIPAGAYYVLADVTCLGQPDAIAAAMHILETVGVASVPGSSFFSGPQGEGLVRFCYAKDWPVLREACTRLRQLP
jgi:aminotransferase